jgi:glycosyltransferase involved in cell wall biosynthesis
VLAQTYDKWEYVIVNNCSTDRTLEIAQQYAQQDVRIRIRNNSEFLTVMQNGNHALRQISTESKYCKVLHADDWLFPDCLSEMVKVAEANPTVGIVGAYWLEGDWVKPVELLPFTSTVISGRELCRVSLLDGPYVFGSPTSLLIHSDLIRSRPTFYNESNIHSDEESAFDVLQDTDFGFIPQVLTYLRLHNESQTSSSRRFNTYILGKLTILTKYGPLCLSHKDYEKRLRKLRGDYYKFLGRSVFQRREKAFWDYHKNGLKNLGYPFSRVQVGKGAIFAMLDRFSRSVVNTIS